MAKKIDQNSSLRVLSEQKGSNPGGFCIYKNGKTSFKGYFKYCVGSKISHEHSALRAEHQPFYEAITFEFAKRLGLKTPSFFVLLNNLHLTGELRPDQLYMLATYFFEK